MSHLGPTKAPPASAASPDELAAEAPGVHLEVPLPAPTATAAPSVHWSKDFVEHLRLVHFALIAAAIGLIAVSSSRTSPDYEHARAQLAEIRLLETRLTQKSHDPLTALEAIFAQELVRYEPLDNPTDFAPLRNVSSYTAVAGRLSAKDLPGGHIDVSLGPHIDTVFRDYYNLVGPTDARSFPEKSPSLIPETLSVCAHRSSLT